MTQEQVQPPQERDDAAPGQTFWLVTVFDEELPGEPDVGLAVSLGSEADADALGLSMTEALAAAGHARCAHRARELEVGRPYRASALLATSRTEAWRREALAESDRYVGVASAARASSAVRRIAASAPRSRAFCVRCGAPVEANAASSGCPRCLFDAVTSETDAPSAEAGRPVAGATCRSRSTGRVFTIDEVDDVGVVYLHVTDQHTESWVMERFREEFVLVPPAARSDS